MKMHPIESQRPIAKGKSSFSYGFTKDKNEQIKKNRTVVVNITPELNMYTSTQFVGSTTQTLFGANKNRRYLLIQNNGAETAFLGFGSFPTVGGDNAIELPAGFQISFENGYVPNNDCSAICTLQTRLSIIEGVISL